MWPFSKKDQCPSVLIAREIGWGSRKGHDILVSVRCGRDVHSNGFHWHEDWRGYLEWNSEQERKSEQNK